MTRTVKGCCTGACLCSAPAGLSSSPAVRVTDRPFRQHPVCARVLNAKADIYPVPMLVHVMSSRDVSDEYVTSRHAD